MVCQAEKVGSGNTAILEITLTHLAEEITLTPLGSIAAKTTTPMASLALTFEFTGLSGFLRRSGGMMG
jgi:hypothetical protein